ncbi:MAG: choice-of-anchor P family protein, partial [Gemmatimonadales bacterium]
MSANVPANTKVNVGNITVWLNRVHTSGNGLEVRMIEITVSGSNPLGLPIGSDIAVASAFAAAYPHP